MRWTTLPCQRLVAFKIAMNDLVAMGHRVIYKRIRPFPLGESLQVKQFAFRLRGRPSAATREGLWPPERSPATLRPGNEGCAVWDAGHAAGALESSWLPRPAWAPAAQRLAWRQFFRL